MTKGIEMQLVRCSQCHQIYVNPIPESFATGHYYDDRSESFYLSSDKLQSDYSPVRFIRELRLFRRWCAQGKVLDVGCSTGAFLYQLKTQFPGNYVVYGNDIAQDALAYAEKQGINVLRNPYLETQVTEFDAITFWAVLEHLVDPLRFLEHAHKGLKEGGICIALTPNFHSLATRLLGRKYRYILPEHVNYFTPQSLIYLFEKKKGWQILEQGSMHFNPIVIIQDLNNKNGLVSDDKRVQLLKKTTALKQSRTLKPLKWLYTVSEQLLAKVNLADNIFIVAKKIQS